MKIKIKKGPTPEAEGNYFFVSPYFGLPERGNKSVGIYANGDSYFSEVVEFVESK